MDEHGLATVLSHEIAHVVAKHTAEEISRKLFVGIASIPALPVLLPAKFGLTIPAELLLIFSPYLFALSAVTAWFSRNQEIEADYIGLKMMASAGYDIEKAVGFWERMKVTTDKRLAEKDENGELKYGRHPELFGLHPYVSLLQMKKLVLKGGNFTNNLLTCYFRRKRGCEGSKIGFLK